MIKVVGKHKPRLGRCQAVCGASINNRMAGKPHCEHNISMKSGVVKRVMEHHWGNQGKSGPGRETAEAQPRSLDGLVAVREGGSEA